MSQPSLTEELGLTRDTNFLRDPLWWAIALAGVIVVACLWVLIPDGISAQPPRGPAQWISLILWQPVLEELAFRGLLQGQLLKALWARRRLLTVSTANLMTSLAFTGLHFLHHPPLWALGVFAPSLVFGWLRERHRNIWSPMVMHGLFNAEFFLTAWLASY